MESSDLIIQHGVIVTMDNSRSIITDGAIVIEGGKIKAIGSSKDISESFTAKKYIEAHGKAILPGIVNVHTHVCGTLFKGLTEDRINSFYGLAFPMEKHLTPELTYKLSLLGCLETIKAGSTCINDLYHFMDQTAEAVDKVGLRAELAHKIYEYDLTLIQYNQYVKDRNEGERRVAKNIDLINKWHKKGNGRIRCRFGPHAADTLSLELHKEVAKLAREYGVGLHIHVAQKTREVEFIQNEYGMGAVELIQEAGIVGPDVVAAHLIFIKEQEIDILKETGTNMAHCAMMTAKRGNFAKMKEIYAKGVNVALGTDWVSMDPWDNMRFAIGAARLQGCTEETINATSVLRMATIESAKALGLEDEIGSLEVGKKADIITLNLDRPHLRPLHIEDIIPVIVYNASGQDVHDVIIDGVHLIQNGVHAGLDEKEIIKEGQNAAEYIWSKVTF